MKLSRSLNIPFCYLLGSSLMLAWVTLLYSDSPLLVAPKAVGTLEITHLFSTITVVCVGLVIALMVAKLKSLCQRIELLYATGVLATLATIAIPLVSSGFFDSNWLIICVIVTAGAGVLFQLAWYERFVAYDVHGAFVCIMVSCITGAILALLISLLPQIVAIIIIALLPSAMVLLLRPSYKSDPDSLKRSEPRQGLKLAQTLEPAPELKPVPAQTPSQTPTPAPELKSVPTQTPSQTPTPVPASELTPKSAFPSIPIILGYIKIVPIRLILVVGIISLTFGMLKTLQIQTVPASADTLQPVLALGLNIISLIVMGVIAYYSYRTNALLMFYFSIPIMAIAALMMFALESIPLDIPLLVAGTGTGVIQLLVLLQLVKLAREGMVPIVFSAAVLSASQFLGTLIGQMIASSLQFEPVAFAMILLMLLIVAALPLIGMRSIYPKVANEAANAGGIGIDIDIVTNSVNTANVANDAAKAVITMSETSLTPDSQAMTKANSSDMPPINKLELLCTNCGLSPREQEVLKIWVTGHNSAYLEQQLHVTKNTIKTHLSHIYTKTGTSSREELLVLLERQE